MIKPIKHPLILLFLLLTLTGCGLGSVLRSNLPTATPVVVRVSADDIAKAMQDDEFYFDYRGDLLLVRGVLHAVVNENGSTLLELETSLPTKAICDLGAQAVTLQPGDEITVQAFASQAERAPSAVVLKNCRMP